MEDGNPAKGTEPASAMSQEELCRIGEEVFGRYGWQTAMARALGVNGSTVRRWKMEERNSSHLPIPPDRAAQIRHLLKEHRLRATAASPGEVSASAERHSWHRRALQLVAATATLDEKLRAAGRGEAKAEVLEILGSIVVRLSVTADEGPSETVTLSEDEPPDRRGVAMAKAEARIRAFYIDMMNLD